MHNEEPPESENQEMLEWLKKQYADWKDRHEPEEIMTYEDFFDEDCDRLPFEGAM